MTQFYNNAVFWVEVDKIEANPFQPRKEFDEQQLQSLADSIRQYGVLQALVVTRKEEEKDDGGLMVKYELISGERRLRASRLAGVREVPVLIRTGEEDNKMKLELAIIENIQREDLNVVDRARAFQKLIDEFGFSHSQVAKRVGKSREYVTNTLRVLALGNEILDALSSGKLSEGHARPLGMLSDRPEQQTTLFKEIVYKKLAVREAERIARRVAYDKVRKKDQAYDPEVVEIEEKFAETLGTRVHIERKQEGGRISIDYFSEDDLQTILGIVSASKQKRDPNEMLYKHIERTKQQEGVIPNETTEPPAGQSVEEAMGDLARQRQQPEPATHQSSAAAATAASESLTSPAEPKQPREPTVSPDTYATASYGSAPAAGTANNAPEGAADDASGDAPLKPDYADASVPREPGHYPASAYSQDHNPGTPTYAHTTTAVDTAMHEVGEAQTQDNESAPADGDKTGDSSDDDLYSIRNFTI